VLGYGKDPESAWADAAQRLPGEEKKEMTQEKLDKDYYCERCEGELEDGFCPCSNTSSMNRYKVEFKGSVEVEAPSDNHACLKTLEIAAKHINYVNVVQIQLAKPESPAEPVEEQTFEQWKHSEPYYELLRSLEGEDDCDACCDAIAEAAWNAAKGSGRS